MSGWLLNTLTSFALQAPFLFALGLYFDVFRRHNFLLAAAYALSLLVTVAVFQFGGGIAVAVLAAAIASFLLLAIADVAVFGVLERLRCTPDEILVATLGANIIASQALSAFFGDQVRFPSARGSGSPGWLLAHPPSMVAIPIGVVVLLTTVVILRMTEAGARIVALGENPRLFGALGFHPKRWEMLALAGIAAILGVSALGAVNVNGAYPDAGFALVILGFLTRLLGGPTSRWRFTLVAAGVIVFDQVLSTLLPGAWRTVLLFGALLTVLSIRGLVIRRGE